MTVLLVDDDPAALRLQARLLSLNGYQVIECSDGEDAWNVIRNGDVSLVISDWLMPRLSGVELCRRIRGHFLDRYIYVILCTAKGDKEDLIEGMDAGADDFLVKPVGAAELRVRVRAGERILTLERGLAQRNRELADANHDLRSAWKLIEDDLKAAAWVQENLLPPPSLKANCTTGEWYFRPTSYVAGDILNCFNLDEHHVGFYMLDVSGHGVPAAMLSVTMGMVLTPESGHGSPLKSYNPATTGFDVASPGDAVEELNRRFQLRDDRFFTLIYCVLDTRTFTLRMAQAGHPIPVIMRANGGLDCPGTGGMPLGLFPDIDFDRVETRLESGDRILLFSDGVTECMNAGGGVFGEERLMRSLRALAGLPLREILKGLEAELDAWRGEAEHRDDVSLMILEFRSPAEI